MSVDNFVRFGLFDQERIDWSANHVLCTRFGIGITDPDWLEYRIRLFQAMTFPSVLGQDEWRGLWLIFVDAEWPRESLSRLIDISRHCDSVRVVAIDFYFQYFECIEKVVSNSIEKYGSCIVSKLDDDDSLAKDTFKILYAHKEEFFVYTFSTGYELLCQERILRPVQMPYLTMNTHFVIRDLDECRFLRVGHHRVKDIAEAECRKIVFNKTTQPMWLYARHKQSDSRFAAVRKSVLEDLSSRSLKSSDYSRFSVDFDELQNFRAYAASAKSVSDGKTWLRQAKCNESAEDLYKKLKMLRIEISDGGSNVLMSSSG